MIIIFNRKRVLIFRPAYLAAFITYFSVSTDSKGFSALIANERNKDLPAAQQGNCSILQ
jgi:hypothetical protein